MEECTFTPRIRKEHMIPGNKRAKQISDGGVIERMQEDMKMREARMAELKSQIEKERLNKPIPGVSPSYKREKRILTRSEEEGFTERMWKSVEMKQERQKQMEEQQRTPEKPEKKVSISQERLEKLHNNDSKKFTIEKLQQIKEDKFTREHPFSPQLDGLHPSTGRKGFSRSTSPHLRYNHPQRTAAHTRSATPGNDTFLIPPHPQHPQINHSSIPYSHPTRSHQGTSSGRTSPATRSGTTTPTRYSGGRSTPNRRRSGSAYSYQPYDRDSDNPSTWSGERPTATDEEIVQYESKMEQMQTELDALHAHVNKMKKRRSVPQQPLHRKSHPRAGYTGTGGRTRAPRGSGKWTTPPSPRSTSPPIQYFHGTPNTSTPPSPNRPAPPQRRTRSRSGSRTPSPGLQNNFHNPSMFDYPTPVNTPYNPQKKNPRYSQAQTHNSYHRPPQTHQWVEPPDPSYGI
eukprot:TRINITY_DN35582_c0_g2_i1.p1 TRINITY_DN35582_c0_g2~~TRINITY_DN35582_c0_g2_i1.p1  ORF type:complete len:458 (-),score=43.86 TRINITY_DN35582_c0_g2_i1:77-1450(-)